MRRKLDPVRLNDLIGMVMIAVLLVFCIAGVAVAWS